MKRRVKLGKEITMIGNNRYSVFYDTKTLAEIYCFLFDKGEYQIETEWKETYEGQYDPEKQSFQDVLANHQLILV